LNQTPSNPSEWREFWEFYERAAELPPAERLVFVESLQCTPDVARELVELLAKLDNEPTASVAAAPRKTGSARYVVMQELGRGGMGQVFAARDTELDRMVAIKVLPQTVVGASSVERLITEARAASALNHPNIVTVHEVIEWESGLAIVMEMVQGKALRLLLGQPLANEDITRLANQIAAALVEAHAHGIIHCDIKPENILVRQDGYVKLLDFGLARRLDSGLGSPDNPATGTLRYMSPEQARAEVFSVATDIFSFGIVLHEMATGSHPFEARSPFDVVHLAATQEPQPASHSNVNLHPGLVTLILAMLNKQPALRPSAEAVAAALQRIQEESSRESSENQSTARTARSQLRESGYRVRLSMRSWIIALSLLSLLGIAMFLMVRGGFLPIRHFEFQQVTSADTANRVTAAAISADGDSLLFGDAEGGVHLRAMKSGDTTTLCRLPNSHLSRIAWFPNGSQLLLSGFVTTTRQSMLWLFNRQSKELQVLRNNASQGVPSPDGREIAFLNPDGSEIWVALASGALPRQLVKDSSRGAFQTVLWSADGRRLLYTRRKIVARRDPGKDRSLDWPDIESTYETADKNSGQILGKQPANGLSSPFALANGHVFFVQSRELLPAFLVEVTTEPKTGKFLSATNIVAPLSSSEGPTDMTATADGRAIFAVLRKSQQPDVYVGGTTSNPLQLTEVRRLTFNTTPDFPHSWMADSRTVVFESNRNGDWQIFKQQLDDSDGEVAVHGSKWDVMPQVSPDGKWILYLHDPRFLPYSAGQPSKRVWKLMRATASGGDSQAVPGGDSTEEFQCAAVGGRRCVWRTEQDGQFVFYDLDPVQGKGRLLRRVVANRGLFGDWSLSPQGNLVALPDHDSFPASFRIIDLEHPENHEIEHRLAGISTIASVTWATGRPGWFVAAKLFAGLEILYVDERGSVTSLLETAGDTWSVPSPDGRHLAFVDGSIDSNAWKLQR
jgi:eukaryotic-like serine/threonine-protein kinase